MRHAIAALLLLASLALLGCYERVTHDSWSQFREMADKSRPATPHPTNTFNPDADSGWAVLIEGFDGDRAEQRAAKLAERLVAEARLSEVWIKHEDKQVTVMRGHYRDPAADDARAGLEETRGVTLDGVRPYESVQVVALSSAARRSNGEFDLKQFIGQGLHSLQVAAFDDAYGKGYQLAAEKYAAELRAKGDQAYFYHGPTISIVTIGLFSEDDFTDIEVEQPSPSGVSKFKQKVYGPKILDLQKTHPFNIFNGYTIKEKQPDGTSTEQPSFTVLVQ